MIERITAAAGVVAFVAGSFLVWFFNPSDVDFFPVCPLFSITGIACPGCGLTRAFHAFFHGDVLTALDYNALFPFYIFILGYFFVSMLLIAVKNRGLSFNALRPKFILSFFVISIVFAVARNLPVYPFSVLYP